MEKGLTVMKKTITKILCSMISLMICLSGINVFAQAPTMNMDWYGDYSDSENPKLLVEFKTPVEYNQRVMMTVYPYDSDGTSSADYVRVKEIATGSGKTEKITINITEEFDATGGVYKVELNGNGYQQALSKETKTVYIIKPTDIPGILDEFKNAATWETFKPVLDKVFPALRLEEEEDSERLEERIKIMLDIQAKDFGGEFPNLNAVRNAWIVSDVIAYIKTDDGTNAAGLKGKIEFESKRAKNSELIGIDKTDADYVAHIADVCESVLLYKAEYNANSGVKSIADLKGIIYQHMGVKTVNAADRDNVYNKFEKYRTYFELPKTELEKYISFEREDRDKALRSLYNKNFTKNSDLADAFKTGVNGVPTGTAGDSYTPPSDDDEGSSSTGISGLVSAPVTPTQPTVSGFSDLPSSHWAYPYVKQLAENGIIGGYDDGTFKPNKNVTREEFVKMIIGAAGLLEDGAVCNFSDVPRDAWFYSYIASGYVKEIVSGIDEETFGIGRNITRQDVAVIAARIFTRLSDIIPETGESTLTDIDTVSDYAQEAVRLLNGMGIINGFDDGTFRPHDALTRAEAATIISKLISNL